MRDRYFNRKLLNLILVLLMLSAYQVVIHTWAQEERIQQLEYQVEAESQKGSSAPEKIPTVYKDGTYTGEGQGFGGVIQVRVKVKEGKIASVEVTGAEGEDPAYLDSAKAVINQIIEEQDPKADTVSGATYSSAGICDAVKMALEGAMEE